MKNSLSIRIPATTEGLTDGANQTREFLESCGVATATAFAIDLTYEELVTNTIKYAYRDQELHWIEIVVAVDDDLVELEVSDDGEAFDPTAQEPPDTSLPAEERPIGGLGLHLIRNLTDAFSYRREDGCNKICVCKRRVKGA